MPRRSPIALTALEAREVPAAGPLADIFPGVWGSYPHDFATSGKTLFFAADNGHGDEVYASDGTAAGTHLVKDLSPTARGSAPQNLTAAGNGTVFFTADDGAGRALYKSDGTAAGTAKVPGMPAGAITDKYGATGLSGKLVFVVPSGAAMGLYATDGGAPVRLANGPGLAPTIPGPFVANGRGYFQAFDAGGARTLWSTDGTPSGTFSAASRPATDGRPATQPVAELSPGKWLVLEVRSDDTSALTTTDAAGGRGPTLGEFGAFSDLSTPTGHIANSLGLPGFGPGAVVGGKVYFDYRTDIHAPVESWVTDGTPAGTKRLRASADGEPAGWVAGTFGGRTLVADFTGPAGGYALQDAAGNRVAVPTPPAWAGAPIRPQYIGSLTPSQAAPNGLMVFLGGQDGSSISVTDGTATGTRAVDTAGVPRNVLAGLAGAFGRFGQDNDAAVLQGSVYFAGPRQGENRPEPWKLDLAPAPVTPPVKPPVTATVVVNGGDTQRSTVTKITVRFDRAVVLDPTAFELRSQLTGQLVPLTLTSPQVGGATVIDLTFAKLPGGLADGTYTFTIRAAKVSAIGGGTLAADRVTTVTRLFGDLDGDGRYDRASRWMLHERLGARRGDSRYMAAFDVDGDGTIGAADELAVVRNWSKQ